MKTTTEYRVVETIDWSGKVQVRTYPKRDEEKARKGIDDAYEHRGKLLRIYTDEDSAYYRTLATSYHIETREVGAWKEATDL